MRVNCLNGIEFEIGKSFSCGDEIHPSLAMVTCLDEETREVSPLIFIHLL